MRRLLPAILVALGVVPAGADETPWKYVGDVAVRPLPRTIALAPEKPDDLREGVVFRGKLRR